MTAGWWSRNGSPNANTLPFLRKESKKISKILLGPKNALEDELFFFKAKHDRSQRRQLHFD